MHDSDLVETLALLQTKERARFFAFLKTRDDDAFATEAAFFAQYIFDCLDGYEKKIAPAAVWEHLPESGDYREESLDHIATEAFDLAKSALKTMKKRLPEGKDNLQGLISILSYPEQEKLLDILQKNGAAVQASVWQLIRYRFACWNEYLRELSESTVYRHVFGTEKEVTGKLAKHRGATLKRLRRFIAIETADKHMSELQEFAWLQKFFKERNGSSQYYRTRSQILRKKNERSQWSSLDYYCYFTSDAEEYDFQSNRNERTNDLNLWNTIQSLDEYYLVERLWYSCQLLNQNQVAPLALPPLSEWLHINSKSPRFKWFFDKPLGKMFVLALDLLSDEKGEDKQKLQNFIAALRQKESHFSKEITNAFEVFACNYGIRRFNRGDSFYANLVFEIQQHRAKTERIYSEGKILSGEFRSIVALGLFLRKFDWIRDFIEKNKKKVSGVMSSLLYYEFCRAQYLYAVENLLQALQILMNVDYQDIHCKISARILEIKVLYELEASGATRLRVADQLDERIEAAILFFFRLKNVPLAKKTMGKRFADFMKKIVRATGNRRLKLLEKIRRQVETIDYIAERQWLLRILDELIEKLKKGGKK